MYSDGTGVYPTGDRRRTWRRVPLTGEYQGNTSERQVAARPPWTHTNDRHEGGTGDARDLSVYYWYRRWARGCYVAVPTGGPTGCLLLPCWSVEAHTAHGVVALHSMETAARPSDGQVFGEPLS